MTHTPGFEEAIKELITENPDRLIPLGETVKRWTPNRIFKAGTMPAYSNYATALAGYIVERVSGLSFRRLPRPEHLPAARHGAFVVPAAVAEGARSRHVAGLQVWAPTSRRGTSSSVSRPRAALAATGADMARFMIAHLQNGAYGDQRILSEETAKLMHGTPLTIIPGLNRMLLGFYETNTNGRRVIAHGGDTQYFHSDLQLYIDDGVGYFISVNSAGKEGAAGPLRGAFFRQFSDRYLPGPDFKGKVDEATAKEHAQAIAGTYLFARRAESSLISVLRLSAAAQGRGQRGRHDFDAAPARPEWGARQVA